MGAACGADLIFYTHKYELHVLTEAVINKAAAAILRIRMNRINRGNSFSSASLEAILACVVFTSFCIEPKMLPATLSVVGALAAFSAEVDGAAAAGAGVGAGAGSAAGVEEAPPSPASHEGCSPSISIVCLLWLMS